MFHELEIRVDSEYKKISKYSLLVITLNKLNIFLLFNILYNIYFNKALNSIEK